MRPWRSDTTCPMFFYFRRRIMPVCTVILLVVRPVGGRNGVNEAMRVDLLVVSIGGE